MSIFEYTLESIEKNLDGYLLSENTLRKQGIKGGGFPESEIVDKDKYKARKENIPYSMFIHQADYHYFVSRVLFHYRVYQYALFVGQQCIENYFKALLKHQSNNFPDTHDLEKLLNECRRIYSKEDSWFIHSEYIRLIIQKFNPFYELPRYPIPKRIKVKGDSYAVMDGDEQYLDYFVFRVREILILPENGWDILSNTGHFLLYTCRRTSPEFYQLFIENNINFNDM